MHPTHNSVVCAGLGLDWPDGTTALHGLDLAFGPGRTGVVGRNGGGKSTLLRLIAGELHPTRGTISRAGEVAYLPQRLPLATGSSVAGLLGIETQLAALRAITAGDADPAHFTALDDDWEVETGALESLARVGAPAGDTSVLDRPVADLSGGEAVLVGLAGLLVRRAEISLLDEPSNNLDRRARELLHAAVDAWPGVLIVVSHDRELLERVDAVVELRDGAARTFGGPYSTYQATVAAEQETAARLLRAAEGDVAREQRQLVEARTRLAQRQRVARRAEREHRVPKIVAHGLRQQAQVSAGKHRQVHEERLGEARAALAEAGLAVRNDDTIRVELPATGVPAGRIVLRVGELTVRGPERIALTGPNGSGKTTLLEAVARRRPHPSETIEAPPVPVGYLPQRLDGLADDASVLDNVRSVAPHATAHQMRAGLARFLVRGDRVDRLVGGLSGGERLRVALACLLLADPAPQLLLLDEPTNSLDLDSVAQLTQALSAYRGALVVVSHDERFLADVGVTRRWAVTGIGLPTEVGGSA